MGREHPSEASVKISSRSNGGGGLSIERLSGLNNNKHKSLLKTCIIVNIEYVQCSQSHCYKCGNDSSPS